MCLTSRCTFWNIPPHTFTQDRNTCVNAHTPTNPPPHTHETTGVLVTSEMAAHPLPVVCTAVRLFSICETLSSLHLNHPVVQHLSSAASSLSMTFSWTLLSSGTLPHQQTQYSLWRVSHLCAFCTVWWRSTSAFTESISPWPAWAVSLHGAESAWQRASTLTLKLVKELF